MAGGNYPAGPPPKEAVDYLRRKGVRAGYDYREIWREEHAVSFTVANMMKLDMLSDVQASITKALEEGTPADKWKKGMAEEMAKRGWWGRYKPPDPKDPKAVAKANLYMSRRLDTIWRVNTRQAAQAGVWERGQRSKSHPYILYRVGPSKKHREQHLAWDGVLLPKDDPFWAVANPMNGWGCKCYTRFVNQAQYERYVKSGVRGVKKLRTEAPVLQPIQYVNPRTKQTHTGYKGINPGFERNPGVGRMQQLGHQFSQRDRSLALARDIRPQGAPVPDGLNVTLHRKPAKRAQHALDSVASVHGDGNLPTIPIEPMPAKKKGHAEYESDPATGAPRYIQLKAKRGAPDPDDGGTMPELSLVHEIGHFLDHSGVAQAARARFGHKPRDDSESDTDQDGRSYESTKPTLPAMRDLMRTIRSSPTYQDIAEVARRGGSGSTHWRYLRYHKEIFARAYAQYIAWRSGSPVLREQIDAYLNNLHGANQFTQWPYDEFLPIVEAFDTLFEELGWLTRT